MEDLQKYILIAVAILLVIIIIYFTCVQKFSLYDSGALQRYASEFTGTNQGSSIMPQLAFGSLNIPAVEEEEHFEQVKRTEASILSKIMTGGDHHYGGNVNRYAADKAKVQHNSPKSMALEQELFNKTISDNIVFNM